MRVSVRVCKSKLTVTTSFDAKGRVDQMQKKTTETRGEQQPTTDTETITYTLYRRWPCNCRPRCKRC